MPEDSITLRVNGEARTLDAPGTLPLLWALRERLGLTGTKYGCGVGACGICIVHVDGEPMHACTTPLEAVRGRAVTTIEGLAREPGHPVVRAWIDAQVPQCGYCQPGQVMAAAALLARHPHPDEAQIARFLSPVLCRCGTQPRIRRALHAAAAGGPTEAATPAAGTGAEIRERRPGYDEDGERPPPTALNPWVAIGPDNRVTVRIDRSEMGQGVLTALATLVAEELEVDLAQVRTEFAPADPAYANPLLDAQITGGSTAVRAAWTSLRRAAAQAREQLRAAAAERWGVTSTACRAQAGAVVHVPSGRRLRYAQLAAAAAARRAPRRVTLKDPADFRIIGRAAPRLDAPAMVDGSALYGIDVARPGQRTAVIDRCPVIGGCLRRADATRARQVPGVTDVIELEAGVAVIGTDTWAALCGREALEVTWDEGANAALSTETVHQRLAGAAERRGRVELNRGRVGRALERPPGMLAADYETPYLAHATMETMNCTARVTGSACEVWVGTQAQGDTRAAAARVSGLPEDAVRVHTLFLGGGFGRRLETDFVEEAVALACRLDVPVKVIWTRSDDMRHDRFRPANLSRMRAALGRDGRPSAWFQRVVGPELALDGIDVPYAIPHLRIETVKEDPGLPTGAWRSVGASQNAFAIECFIDELAQAAGQDPVAYRRALLAEAPRERATLELAAERAGWGTPAPPGRHRGVALYRSFGSVAAQVAEISLEGGRVHVHRVVCAADCGTLVNPDIAAAQLEGGIIFGLSAALHGEITLEHGRVRQATFEDYPIVTLATAPEIEVHFVDSREPPSGVGEPGVPPIAPAVANAVAAGGGGRRRRLPLRPDRA